MRSERGRARRRVRIKAPWKLVLASLVIVGCDIPKAETSAESIGPRVKNECDQPVVAEVGDSLQSAESEIRESPVVMQPGWSSSIRYFVQNDDVVPDDLFLLVGVVADDAALLQFKTSELRGKVVTVVFLADCRTLIRE